MKKGILLLGALAFLGCAALNFSAPPSDAALKASIVSALKAETSLDSSHVEVDVNSGIVVVSGMVDSAAQKKLLKKIVYHVFDVKNPAFNLIIKE